MLANTLAIENPYGICVFGSALLKVAPDSVLVNSAVTRTEQNAPDAFSKAKESAQAVADFLRRSNVDEFGASRVSLNSDFRFTGGEQRFYSYRATVGFTIKIAKLEMFEPIMTGIVAAGVNEIRSVQFQTSDLKNLRSQARARAVDAAKEKAANYAEAAGVTLGRVIHIQDVNPLQGSPGFHGGLRAGGVGGQNDPLNDLEEAASDRQSLDPSAIEVTAAVLVAFKLD